jgi:predicted HicB family RNase H-like nuclease
MGSPAQSKASVKYNKSRDSITLRPTKEHGEKIRLIAEKSGQSLQGYILQAIDERIEREEKK